MKKLKILLQSNVFYIGFFFFLCFYVFFFTKVLKYETKIPSNTTEIKAKILSYTIDGDKLSLLLKAKEKISATYYIQSKEEKEELQNNLLVGKTLKLYGKQKEVIGMTIPNTFDYKKYLYHERIYFSFQATKVEIVNHQVGFLNRIKNKIEKRLQSLGNNAYLRAFIIGDKTLIDNEQYDHIMENGVSHLFALSGMHLSFLYLILEKILKKIKWKKVIIYSFLFLYLFITGFSVSFLRAILFLLLLDLNKKWKVGISNKKILFFTAFLLLLVNPFYIYNVGFWYTFVITFSLLFCSSLLEQKSKLLQILLVSTITFLFSFPISIYLNYEINLLSVFNNILLVPFISTFVFPLAILTFLFSFLLPIFTFFIFLLEKMNVCFASFAIPLIVGKINLLEVILYYVILLLAIEFHSKKMGILLFLFVVFLYNQNLFVGHYEVYFLDVGQGDSTLIVTPQNKEVILIDTGGSVEYPKKDFQIRNKEFNLGESIVTFLKSKRIRKIDRLLLTHGDYDHAGKAIYLVNNFKVKKVVLNCGPYNDLENSLIKVLDKKKIPYSACMKELIIKDSKLYFLNTKEYDNENDNSSVIYTELNNYKLLFMGDASILTEKAILSKYNLSNIDVLKVGHHGSKTSSSKEFINSIHPKYSIISVGRNNRYGHPNQEVLNILNNSKVYRTDQDGSIMFKIKDHKLEIETCA